MEALRRSTASSSSSLPPSSASLSSSPPLSSWIHLRSLLVVASSSSSSSSSTHLSDRGNLRSAWSRRKRKHALSRRQWCCLFSANGRLRDGGVMFLKKVRRGGIDPSIRAEVWPFLLGVYDLNSSEAERNDIMARKRNEYGKLRQQCEQLAVQCGKGNGPKDIDAVNYEEGPSFDEGPESPGFAELNGRASVSDQTLDLITGVSNLFIEEEEEDKSGEEEEQQREEDKSGEEEQQQQQDKSGITSVSTYTVETESSDSESSDEEESESVPMSTIEEGSIELDPKYTRSSSVKGGFFQSDRTSEDFATWQRIIRVDAVRINPEWVLYSTKQATVSEEKALQYAESVGLKEYEDLEPCMIYHAARLVAILEAYAVYDPEIGYCQGMSDLLSPIVALIEEDHEAFWCFVGFMRKARHNFRLDEVGIQRQLNIVSKIIKCKDSHLYRHLEKLQAEDCCFVYRMVVVLFRRELTFEQTACLWEVMWADQAAIRAGIGKSMWGRIRLRAPPTDDLLLYAVAASVLQRRKLIIQKYNSMDEILRECNSMAGQLDVWRLLEDAHDLIVNLHNKI